MKYLSKKIFYLMIMASVLPSWKLAANPTMDSYAVYIAPTKLKTFGDIAPPVYRSTSRGGIGSGYGAKYRFVYLETPPSVGGHTYFLPESRRPLRWSFSAVRKRGTSDGGCYVTGFGVLRVELRNIQSGDICVVTATVSHPGYESKSVSVDVHWHGPSDIETIYNPPPPPTPPEPKLKTFGDIAPPVYKSTSRGGPGFGGEYRFVYLETPPSVGGHTYFLPESRRPLRWSFSAVRKRGTSDGGCYMTGFGVLRVELRNIQSGDICVVTATVSHPGYESKSVSVDVHWHGPSDIETIYNPPPPPTPPEPKLKTFGDIAPPVYRSTSRGGIGSGYGAKYRFVYLETPPSVGGHTYFLPESRRPLRWSFSAVRKRGTSDGGCYVTGFGVLRVELRNIQSGDICVVTATVSHPGYESKSVSVDVHWYGPSDIQTVPHTP